MLLDLEPLAEDQVTKQTKLNRRQDTTKMHFFFVFVFWCLVPYFLFRLYVRPFRKTEKNEPQQRNYNERRRKNVKLRFFLLVCFLYSLPNGYISCIAGTFLSVS